MELLEGEKVLWRGRPTWRAYLGYFLKYGFLALVIGVVVEVLKDTVWDGAPRGTAGASRSCCCCSSWPSA